MSCNPVLIRVHRRYFLYGPERHSRETNSERTQNVGRAMFELAITAQVETQGTSEDFSTAGLIIEGLSQGLRVKRAEEAGGRPTKQKSDADGATAEVLVCHATCARHAILGEQAQAELRRRT